MAKNIKARVLVDDPAHGLRADTIVEADQAVVEALRNSGVVDDDKAAVGYAESQAFEVVKLGTAQ